MTADDVTLRAALGVALQNWAGVDDVEITVVSVELGGATSLRHVEEVDGGFWVDARVFVDDTQVFTQMAREPVGESKKVPSEHDWIGKALNRGDITEEQAIEYERSLRVGEVLGGGRRLTPPSVEDMNREEDRRVENLMQKRLSPELLEDMRNIGGAAARLANFIDRDGDIDALLEGLLEPEDVNDLFQPRAIAVLADAINQLAMMLEDGEYARTTGLRSNSTEFVAKQKRLRKIREDVARFIEE